jgi:hypothetical protein
MHPAIALSVPLLFLSLGALGLTPDGDVCFGMSSEISMFPSNWLVVPDGASRDIQSDSELGAMRPFMAPVLHGGS